MRTSFIFLLILFSPILFAEEDIPSREYPLSVGEVLDARVIARNAIALNKLSYDAFNEGLVPILPDAVVPWIEPFWSFFWTFNFTMWPHDHGHWVRANQAGGNFVIVRYGFPFPLARMDVPENASSLDKTLMSAGGFEINSLMRKYTENRLFETGARDAEDMVHAFIQTMMFPMYTTLIAPTAPSKAETWDNTYGDPVDVVKQVYENYSGKSAVRSDGQVDPLLVRLYWEFYWVNVISVLLDPLTYQMASAFATDMRIKPRLQRSWIYESASLSWSYSSHFNPGALGYEWYATQHLLVNQHYFRFYVRAGRPFKNIGLGLAVPALLKFGDFAIGAEVDVWDQDLFGKGGMISLGPRYRINRLLELQLDVHWKDRGYAIAHKLERGVGALMHMNVYW